MKLITEVNESIEFITEATESGEKRYFIEGIFLQGDITNRNKRCYPLEMLQEKVKSYVKEFVSEKRAFGELGHPEGPTINLDRVSHIITELKQSGKDFVGKAKIVTETPNGKIVIGLLKEGARLGVSSRGVGSIEEKNGINMVKSDFRIATAADIVADPSAPAAFVRGIMEGREWVYDNGILREQDVEEVKRTISRTPSRKLEEAFIKAFEKYVTKLT